MVHEFKLPDIGEGITEAELLQWYVKEGEQIQENQNLAEIETDKAVTDLPSPYAGTVERLHYRPGDRVPVGATLATFAEGETAAKTEPVATAPTDGRPSPARMQEPPSTPVPSRVLAAPATRRRARELGIELGQVRGTGPGGRITDEDLERHTRAQEPAAVASTAASPQASPAQEQRPPQAEVPSQPTPRASFPRTPLPDFAQWGPVERVALSATRRHIAHKMAQSLFTAPHAAALDEADITELEAYRHRAQAQLQAREIHLTLLPFVMQAAVAGLKQFPALNASLDEATQEIILKKYYHLGIAVDTERGLVVPVIRNVERKSLVELAAELEDLVARTRAGKVNLAELRGGTFTLTNAGAVGGHTFISILNYPEVAILGTGRAQAKPVVREGQIVVRTMLPLSMSFDHRVVDGAYAVRFLQRVMALLEDPDRLQLEA
jgi:pyruvate dehydrogenase E2 component (dihydrolipoamide acetyltransferase)